MSPWRLSVPDAPAGEHAAWREALGLLAESTADLLGFGVAAISLVRDDQLVTYAVACDDPAVREGVLGVTTPVSELMRALERADDWGLVKFLPHDRVPRHVLDTAWVPEGGPVVGADGWHPEDVLVGPLRDHDGRLVGFLSVDLPRDGRRPGPERRRLLDRHAELAARAVVNVLERERLAATAALAGSVGRVVREASGRVSLPALVEGIGEELLSGFAARDAWLHVFDDLGLGQGRIHAVGRARVSLPPPLVRIAEETAARAWQRQEANVVGAHTPLPDDLTAEEAAEIRRFQRRLGIGQSLFVPLGAGRECLGNLVITRGPDQLAFTELEREAAMELGHDLGRAVVNTRLHERQRRLVEELRALDSYKTRLLATLSHELKNPLTSVLGYLEVLQSAPVDDRARARLDDMHAHATLMHELVGDLLSRARGAALDGVPDLDDPRTPDHMSRSPWRIASRIRV